MSINTSYGQSNLFGHMDYYMNRAAGKSDREIMQWINANPSKLSVNRFGPGELVQQISSGATNEANRAADSAARAAEIDRAETLQREAEAREVERLKQMEISKRVQAANAARAGMQSSLQIKSGSKEPSTSGTQGFKRRKLQVNPNVYSALIPVGQQQTTLPGVINP